MRVESSGGVPELEDSRWAPRDAGAQGRRRQRQRRPRRGAGAPQPMAAPATAVQRLFEACREVFTGAGPGAVPPPAGVERIKSVLDSITAADVRLTSNMSYFRRVDPHGTPKITYLHLYKCEAFSIGIFCLPSRGVIPLHNHPGMTVFSKLLFGAMHIKSYDWAAAQQDTPDQLQGPHLAKVKVDGILTAPHETLVLYPEDGGNMHCFTAQNACAVLDVLGPPYDDGSGRHCQYYNVASSAISVAGSTIVPGGDRYEWLEESEPPRDFYLVGSTYMGPRILDH
ncbi:plant cysteine oxidase 2 isoform X1 [Sorghum bicolor]|uniref:cysteine dioxygenase n=1 Tax=Sorghum bicolor TaxID=4558 RepID=A0A1B6Q150_SORBI|nr:plant cysteine oxidase 2 isoform X1 [Sorghum bicolor]KXG31656.1 hypothetical protein SORBI_3003G037600 [Sorghum bicolor]|eukprot:XP_021311509.1 plant cysteine oxidase 2 isoform X1 [Sorghum bicolor]